MKEGKKTPEMWKEKRIKETDEKGEFWPFLLRTAPARTSAHCTFVSIFSSHVPHAHAPQQLYNLFGEFRIDDDEEGRLDCSGSDGRRSGGGDALPPQALIFVAAAAVRCVFVPLPPAVSLGKPAAALQAAEMARHRQA
nr:hypothetical protein Itr_chr10CG16780 [Ipomoea trifida]